MFFKKIQYEIPYNKMRKKLKKEYENVIWDWLLQD